MSWAQPAAPGDVRAVASVLSPRHGADWHHLHGRYDGADTGVLHVSAVVDSGSGALCNRAFTGVSQTVGMACARGGACFSQPRNRSVLTPGGVPGEPRRPATSWYGNVAARCHATRDTTVV